MTEKQRLAWAECSTCVYARTTTQKDFVKRFGISKATLYLWRKEATLLENMGQSSIQCFIGKLRKQWSLRKEWM